MSAQPNREDLLLLKEAGRGQWIDIPDLVGRWVDQGVITEEEGRKVLTAQPSSQVLQEILRRIPSLLCSGRSQSTHMWSF